MGAVCVRVCMYVHLQVRVHVRVCTCRRVCVCSPADVRARARVCGLVFSECVRPLLVYADSTSAKLPGGQCSARRGSARNPLSCSPPSALDSPKLVSLSSEKPIGGAQGQCRAPGVRDTGSSVSLTHCSGVSSRGFILTAQDGC